MSYTSLVYLGFVAVTMLFYYVLPLKSRPYVLLVASLFFYFLHSYFLVLFPLATTMIIYLCARKMGRLDEEFKAKRKELEKQERKVFKKAIAKRKKRWLLLAIVSSVSVLFVFKYMNSIGSGANAILSLFNVAKEIPKLNLIAPLAVSYYTLQSLSYAIDVSRGAVKAEKNPFHLMLFVFYFPHILEGPIGRYNDLAPQLTKGNPYNYDNLRSGGLLLLWGVFLKMVIADRAAMFASPVFKAPDQYDGFVILVGVLLFTLQLYADFAGIITISRGISQMFGIELAQNFNQPFFSKNIQEFWRRWHMTLGSWLKDYIFYPVSLSKPLNVLTKKVRKISKSHVAKILPALISLFFVWIGNGIWHGAGGKYIFYGMYYYVIMAVGMMLQPVSTKVLKKLHINKDGVGYGIFQVTRTVSIVSVGMLIFRASTLTQAKTMLFSIFTKFSLSTLTQGGFWKIGMSKREFLVLFVASLLLLTISILKEKGKKPIEMIHSRGVPTRWGIYILLLFAVLIFGAYGEGYAVLDPIYNHF